MKQPWRHIISLFLLLLPLTGQAQNNENNIDARKRAVDYFHLESVSLQEQGRYDESYEMLEHCYALDPTSTATQFFLSSYYTILGKDSIASKMLEYIVSKEPDNEEYNDALVNQYARTGNWKAAIAVYERIVKTTHSKNEIYKSLYTLYYNDGNYEKALEILDKIESFDGSTSEVLAKRIQLYLLLNRQKEADAIIEQAIASNQDDLFFMAFIGEVYALTDRYELAEETYLKILEKSPDDVITQSSLVNLYARCGNDTAYCKAVETYIKNERIDTEERLTNVVRYALYKEETDSAYVKPFFQELLQLPFDKVELHESYANYLEYKNADKSELIPIYKKIIELDAENIGAIIKLLQFAIEDEDKEAVFKYADDAIMFLPQNLELYYYKGFSLYLLGKNEESIEVYKEGLEKRDPETDNAVVAAVFTTIGDVYHKLDMMEECFAAYDSALVYEPDKIDVLNNYAYFLSLEERDLQRALEMSYKTIIAEPDNQTNLDTYAWVLFKMKRYEEAKAYAEKVISLNEEMSAEVLHHIGDIFAKCGNIDKAVTYWEKAREAGEDTKILNKKIKKRKYYNGAK